MKILHVSDLHLGALGKGVTRAFRVDMQREQWSLLLNIKSYILNHGIAVLIITGDLFDGPDIDSRWFYKVLSVFSDILNHGIYIVYNTGNHDYFIEDNQMSSLLACDNFVLFCGDVPTTRLLTVYSQTLAFHGVGYSVQQPKKQIALDYPFRVEADFNIGLGHGVVSQSKQIESDYYSYNVLDCKSKGYDLWLLGHVHSHEVIAGNIIYSGATLPSKYKDLGEKFGIVYTLEQGGICLDTLRLSSLFITRHTLNLAVQNYDYLTAKLSATISDLLLNQAGYCLLNIVVNMDNAISETQKKSLITTLHEQYPRVMVHTFTQTEQQPKNVSERTKNLLKDAMDDQAFSDLLSKEMVLKACLNMLRGGDFDDN